MEKIKNIKADGLSDYVPDASKGPDQSLKTPPDVLLVPDPSSLSESATAALVKYMSKGHPTLLLADPLPFFWTSMNPTDIGVLNAPKQPRVEQFSPYAQILSSSPEPKASGGNLSAITQLLGVQWDNGTVAWNLFNPHPSFQGSGMGGPSWSEYFGRFDSAFVFVRKHDGHQPFSQDSTISKGLKEVLFFYPGSVSPKTGAKTNFTPLITLQDESGQTSWNELVYTPSSAIRGFDPNTGRATVTEQNARNQITNADLIVLKPSAETTLQLDQQQHVLAAHIEGRDENPLNAIFICDLDFLSDLFYKQQEELGQQLDNSRFLENAIDILAGRQEFVSLRNRRPTPRTLTEVEKRIETYRSERTKKQQDIEANIRKQLAVAQSDLEKAAEKIDQDQSLSFFQKLQQTSQEASQAQRRFEIKKQRLDDELKLEVKRLETEEQQNINRLENLIGLVSIGLAILPALLLGFIVLIVKTINEHSQTRPSRKSK